MGGAIIGSMTYLGELIVGNMAFLFAEFGISWRWGFVAAAVGIGASGIAAWLLISEPKAGHFVTGKTVGYVLALMQAAIPSKGQLKPRMGRRCRMSCAS